MYSRKEITSLGLATAFCLVWVVALFGSLIAADGMSPRTLMAQFGQGPLLGAAVSALVMLGGLLVAYLLALVRSAAVSDERKRLWAVLFFVAHVFAMAAFWVIHMYLPWHRQRQAQDARRPLTMRARPVPAAPYRKRARADQGADKERV